jgi:hypothetical protein
MNYTAPGNIDELNQDLLQKWKSEQSDLFNSGKKVASDEATPAHNKVWFFNPLDGLGNNSTADIKWNAFPKNLITQFPSKIQAWRAGDISRKNQDEYCEWEVVRNESDGKIERVTFTTETPDYYNFLFEHDKELLLDLYKKYISPNVKIDDLSSNGKYDILNRWNFPEKDNKRGVLIHMRGPNTLWAAIALSAEATWPSVNDDFTQITDEQGLIQCREFGNAGRHSDPHIGAQINALVRDGNEISFAGPVGLYIDSIDLTGFEVPNGINPNDLFTVKRGDNNHILRVVFEAPKDSGFKLGDIKIDGNDLRFGGQIAEKMTIRIRGLYRKAMEKAPSLNCSGQIHRDVFANIEHPLAMMIRKNLPLEYIKSTE